MTDSACRRSGYDSTGRYRVPAPKQSAEKNETEPEYKRDQCPTCGGRAFRIQTSREDLEGVDEFEWEANPDYRWTCRKCGNSFWKSEQEWAMSTRRIGDGGETFMCAMCFDEEAEAESSLIPRPWLEEMNQPPKPGAWDAVKRSLAEEPDQCPDCRAAPGQPHNPECCNVAELVNVPLPLQERLLEAFLLDEWTVVVAAFMERHRGEIVDMAFQRLRDGFPVYGSTMYGWEPERRTNEAIEEVADLLAYLSSGEVE